MQPMPFPFRTLTLFVPFVLAGLPTPVGAEDADKAGSGRVTVLRTPDGGIQPQAAIDARGVIHLIYFQGNPSEGDLFYVDRKPGEDRFSEPVRVNSHPGSAIAAGTIRGGQIALGKRERVHVAWNGTDVARPKNPSGGSPMLYTRSDEGGTAFEPQRNLMTRTSALDGGGTVAADGDGNVYVAWHGRAEDAPDGEMGRRMFVARSKDEGATFAPEEPALERETGACACCGTRALADRRGEVYALYRAATGGVERDMTLLTSGDRGEHFRGASVHQWTIDACPMSSASLAEVGDGVVAAWETKGQIYFALIVPKATKVANPVSPPGGGGDRKHPAVAGNVEGETILVWTEGTGWKKGGDLAWQVFDRSGHPTERKGWVEGGVPVWGLATVVARPDGGFTIIR